MSLGSRLAKRGRTAAIASLASTPREPLSFLYPSWSVTQSKPQVRNFSCTTNDQAFEHWYPRKHRRRSIINKFVGTKTRRLHLPSVESLKINDEQKPDRLPEGSEGEGISQDAESVRDSNIDSKESRRIRRIGSFSEKDLYEPTDLPTLLPQNDGLSKAGVDRIVRRRLGAQAHALRRREYRLEHQNKRRETLAEWGPDWREILGKLCKAIPVGDKWLEKAVEILAPEDAMDQLLYSVDDNIWEISARHDASISLDSYDASTDEYGRLLLSGTESAIRKATADIATVVSRSSPNSLAKRMEVEHVPISVKANRVAVLQDASNDSQKPTFLSYYDGSPRHVLTRKYEMMQPSTPEKIPDLTKINQRSLYEYVWRLANTTMPNHLHGLIYEEDKKDTFTRVAKLKEVLSNPSHNRALSRGAFNLAIKYCVSANQITDVKYLFSLMDKRNILKSVETFNIMLDGTAKQKDLHNFNFIFHIMLKRGTKPNGMTWALLMKTIPDIKIKLYILQEMKERGLLRPLINIKRVAVELCPAEIEHSLSIGESQDTFLTTMDERYSPWWLTSKSGNQVLHALGSRGLISRCWDFLYIMQDRSVKIDHNCVNTILTHCKIMRNINGMVEALRFVPRFFPGRAGFVPDHYTYDVLFEAAWRGRRYNLAKVIWKYACMDGATTRDMRLRVYSSFQSAVLTAKDFETRRQPWYRSAGFFIFNAHSDRLHPTRITRARQDSSESTRFSSMLARFRSKAKQNFAYTEKVYLAQYLKIEDEALAIKEISVVEDVPYIEDAPDCAEDWDGEAVEPEVEGVEPEVEGVEPEVEAEQNTSVSRMSGDTLEKQSPMTGEAQSENPQPELSIIRVYETAETNAFDPNKRRWVGGTASTTFPVGWNKDKFNLHIRPWNWMMGLCARNEHMLFQNWQPVRPFNDMLAEAWALDREWERLMNLSLHAEARTMKWKLENAIQVPIRSKDPKIGLDDTM